MNNLKSSYVAFQHVASGKFEDLQIEQAVTEVIAPKRLSREMIVMIDKVKDQFIGLQAAISMCKYLFAASSRSSAIPGGIAKKPPF